MLTSSKSVVRPFFGIGKFLSKLHSGLNFDLKESDLDFKVEHYAAAAFFNSFIYFLIFFVLIFLLSFKIAGRELVQSLVFGLAIGLGLSLLFFIVLLRYPKILAGKKAEEVDKTLLYALKDLLLQVSSGVSLYNAFVNIANAKYGLVSKEFKLAAQEINTGIAMDKALENMAVRTRSAYLRRSLWQLVNTLKAGASLKGALRTIIDDLTRDQRSKIKDYARELNLWALIYMLFAVAIPTLGVTMLVVLSGFAGFGVNAGTFFFLVIVAIFVQVVIIGFIKTRRPVVQF